MFFLLCFVPTDLAKIYRLFGVFHSPRVNNYDRSSGSTIGTSSTNLVLVLYIDSYAYYDGGEACTYKHFLSSGI